MIMDALVYDARLEPAQIVARAGKSSAAGGSGSGGKTWAKGTTSTAYKPLHTTGALNAMALVPCSACTLVASCEEAHQISPESCEYFTSWLGGVDSW
mmetsp:Transcript_16149/g.40667  ORF Transcript_16149/g.40667 Transcript_16149/m.40667 type:complete len:97 (+) Transcript_16149:154-444(+)